MRKLAWAAGAFSAACFLAAYLLPESWLLPCAAALALLGAAFLLLHRKWLRAAVIVSFASAAALGIFRLHDYLTLDMANAMEGETRAFSAVLLDYPDVYEDYCRAEIRLKTEGAPALNAILYDRSGSLEGAAPGDRIEGSARLSSAGRRYGKRYDAFTARNIYLLASAGELRLSGETAFSPAFALRRLNRALTQRAAELFPADTSAFFQALMLGEKGALYEDEALYVSLSRAGLMHIVAVSGMHVAFLVGFLQLLLGTNKRSSLLCILLVWLFAFVSGASPSALRAAFMQTTLLLAPLLKRENDPPTSLMTVLALLLLLNPRACTSVSLQLSFASVAGLLLFSPRLNELFVPKGGHGLLTVLLRYLGSSAAASLSVLALSLPLTALTFGGIPLLSPVSNGLVLWAVPLCFGGGYLACALSFVLPAAGTALAWLVAWPARVLLLAARLIAAFPYATVYLKTPMTVLWLLLLYGMAILARFTKASPRFRLLLPTAVSLAALVLALFSARATYRSGATIAVLDVGQGQSLAVMQGDSTVVIDCGNTYNSENAGQITGRYLLSCGRRQIDLLMLTHLHADHADGVLRLLELIPVKELVMPVDPNDEDGLLEPILASAARHGIPVSYIAGDETRLVGGIRLALFAPGQSGDANERCLTARISLGDYDMLVTGDIDRAAEKDLIERHDLSGTELLIAGHHGSRYASSGEFLKALGGETAVISVGYNTYGHPTNETLARLDAYGYTIYRTDLNGTVEIKAA